MKNMVIRLAAAGVELGEAAKAYGDAVLDGASVLERSRALKRLMEQAVVGAKLIREATPKPPATPVRGEA